MASPDVRQLPRSDQYYLASGVLVFIASFLPWYGVSYSFKFAGVNSSGSASINAWHSYATLGLLLMLAATVVTAVMLLSSASLPTLPVSWNFVATTASMVGALLVLIRSLNLPSASGPGGSVGLRWGGWLLLVFSVANALLALWRLRDSGEAMPWAQHTAPQPPAA